MTYSWFRRSRPPVRKGSAEGSSSQGFSMGFGMFAAVFPGSSSYIRVKGEATQDARGADCFLKGCAVRVDEFRRVE
jgi:hypothetical protein